MKSETKEFTPLDAAKDLIREDVVFGKSMNEIKSSLSGRFCRYYCAHIGVFIGNKLQSLEKICVKEVGGKEIFEVFNLSDVYNLVKKEMSQPTLF